ncbi:MAG: hypothetical protein HC889_01155 [Synechococcaceae cyanobacterium SM1_2_3]|nr:hypothetical protein [Synechococcaceae cyanobacterium SM1_2_3]
MNRCCFRFWLLLWLCGPTGALALEIGEIQVQSALNQLFDARIPLPALTPEELAKVSVKLAPSPVFKEFGLERSPTLDNLVFAIEYNAEGQVYVRVVSTRPIREPSLGLLIEFGWPRGKTFREFTVFLDPVRRLAKQPGDRSKTVLNTPSAAPDSEPAPAPEAVVAAAAPPEYGSDADGISPIEPVITVATEVLETSESAPAPAPEPLRIYRPGDAYGPVASGEGLWAIALKVRPDPAISREQMMQALFKGNPQAFGKTGIPGLKAGAVLRIPTWREIADFTGSPVARQWAEKESPPDSAQLAATPPAPEPAPVMKAGADAPEAFPLPAPPVLEAQPLPETARVTADPVQPPPVLVIAPTVPDSIPVPERIVPSFPPLPEPTLTPELVSATPLLSLVVAELIAGVNPIAPVALAWETVIGPPVDEKAVAEPTPPMTAAPLPVVAPAATIPPEASTAAAPHLSAVTLEGFRLLAEIEQRLPSPVFELLPPVETPDQTAIPIAAPPEAPPLTPQSAGPSVSAVAPISDRYGPVVANERLWDIADRVRPDPAIGREHIMQALFKANPQAFSKPGNMDSLKVGVTLRVPTLQEIADYTGSKAAKELLDRPRPAAVSDEKPSPR